MPPLNQAPLELQQLAGFLYCYRIKHEAKHSLKALPGRFKLTGLMSHSQQSNGQQLNKLCSPSTPQMALIKEGFKLLYTILYQ